MDIAYNLFAETRAHPDTMRESFHHAKSYVCTIRRFHRLMTSLPRDRWPKPVAAALRQLIKRDGPKLAVYTDARNAIEHVDTHGRTAHWGMALLEDDFVISKQANGSEIKVRVVGGDALKVAANFYGQFQSALTEHFGVAIPPVRSAP
jgi:hypothetical protein